MPRIADLYCCRGGGAMGYHRAGWEVVGFDLEAQPLYPFEFVQANALRVLNVGEYRVPLRLQRKIMKMPWSDLYGISQAVPPAYTEHIGHQLAAHLELRRAA